MDELKMLAQPLVDYLRENHHPHTAIVITDERVVVVEDVIGIPFPMEDAAEEFPHSLSDFDTCPDDISKYLEGRKKAWDEVQSHESCPPLDK